MTDEEKARARQEYKNLVDEINSACTFLLQSNCNIHGATIKFMRESALGEAQLRFFGQVRTRII